MRKKESTEAVSPVEINESDSMRHQRRIVESREILKQPVPKGMALFEAPDGYIILAEEGQLDVLYRQGDNGKGMRINPRR